MRTGLCAVQYEMRLNSIMCEKKKRGIRKKKESG